MDHLLGMFGRTQPEETQESSQPAQAPGAVWEFEMPAEGAVSNELPPVFSVPGGIPGEASNFQETTVEEYFKTLGWPFERVDQGLWILKYSGGAKDYDIFVELTSQYIVLVVPVIDRVREGCREMLWYHLLRLNYMINQARLGVNKRNEVLLTLEIPLGLISYDEFKRGAQHLCSILDDSYPEILFLSQRQEAASSFLKEMESSHREA